MRREGTFISLGAAMTQQMEPDEVAEGGLPEEGGFSAGGVLGGAKDWSAKGASRPKLTRLFPLLLPFVYST